MEARTEQLNKMILSLGYAFYEWQYVERALVGILAAAFKDSSAYVNCFYELKGKRRLGFMDKSIKHQPLDFEKWKALKKAAEIATNDRNAFAHHELIHTNDIDSECQILLVPSIMDRSRYDENFDPKEEPYTYEDIWESIKLFRALASNLRDFSDSIHWAPPVRATRNARLQDPQKFPIDPIFETSRSIRQSRKIG